MHPHSIRNPGLERHCVKNHCILKADTSNPNPVLSKLVQWGEMGSSVKIVAFESNTLWNSFTCFRYTRSVLRYTALPTDLQLNGSPSN